MKVFDAHLHIIDDEFPLDTEVDYTPPTYKAADYRQDVLGLQVCGGAVVSGSFQGFDQTYFDKALDSLGPGFCGVTQLPVDTKDAEVLRLHDRRIRAIRVNLRRRVDHRLEDYVELGQRVYDLTGWPMEIYMNAADIPEVEGLLRSLPAVSIDHLGLTEEGLPHLLRLVDRGLRVKASGFGRVEMDPAEAVRAIYDVNPEALMFGTDLPATRAQRAFRMEDARLIQECLQEPEAERVFFDNAEAWYYGKAEQTKREW
ncbi:amidohydrolase family protein [Alkalicoccus chagannorensis]|uniref:amidohydrolase family protein n=1 Tax=Alkalicoccus chagannorensis TaxID=427072 RepID=UPI00041E0D9B|nr:amidohydrolase family protein [Alkalicoccus chagannorensis]